MYKQVTYHRDSSTRIMKGQMNFPIEVRLLYVTRSVLRFFAMAFSRRLVRKCAMRVMYLKDKSILSFL